MRSGGAPLGHSSALHVHPFPTFVAVRKLKPPMVGLLHQHVSGWGEVWRSPPPVVIPTSWGSCGSLSPGAPSHTGSFRLTFVPGQSWWQF